MEAESAERGRIKAYIEVRGPWDRAIFSALVTDDPEQKEPGQEGQEHMGRAE